MPLRIAKLETTCHVPPQLRTHAEIVDRLARGRFAGDLGEHLGPSFARQPAIVRIRRLPIRVILPASELTEDALSFRWRQEFGKALFSVLAYPAGAGSLEVFRAESVAGFVASCIGDLLDGTAQGKWQYAEFESFFRLGSPHGAVALICEWPEQSSAVLLHLTEVRALNRLLARLEDAALERIFAVLAPFAEAESKTLSLADLITVARLAVEHAPDKALALRSRAYALTLFVEAQRTGQSPPSPRVLFHALLAAAVLLNEDVFWPGVSRTESRAGRLPPNVAEILESIARALAERSDQELSTLGSARKGLQAGRVQSTYTAILENLGGVLRTYAQNTFDSDPRNSMHPVFGAKITGNRETRGAHIPAQLAELDQLLQLLRVSLNIPTPLADPAQVQWISSDWCGLFFLCSTLERLGWVPAWGRLPDFHAGGPACLVAGLALTIAGRFDPAMPSLEPAMALFAGYLHEPDLLHARRVFQESSPQARLNVLRAALPHEQLDQAAESWEHTFQRLAEALLRSFASRLQGFRQATSKGIVRSFIARPGRIRIEPERLTVFPLPSPFNIALHVSGMDDPVDASRWLGRRCIGFELRDL